MSDRPEAFDGRPPQRHCSSVAAGALAVYGLGTVTFNALLQTPRH